jgi:hypothetical protein
VDDLPRRAQVLSADAVKGLLKAVVDCGTYMFTHYLFSFCQVDWPKNSGMLIRTRYFTVTGILRAEHKCYYDVLNTSFNPIRQSVCLIGR